MTLVIMGIAAVLLVYWFWPGKARCEKCESELNEFAYCTNLVCPYASREQPFEQT